MHKMNKFLAAASIAALSLTACSAGSADEGTDDTGGGETVATDTGGASDTETAGASDTETAEVEADEASDTEAAEVEADGAEAAETPQASDLTFHMITHSDDGPFWTVAKAGADAAAADLGIELVWLGSNNDPEAQVQLIDQAISEGTDGIASSLPSPAQLVGPLTEAVNAGIPVVTLNSGVEHWQDIGALTHVGQTELIAGQGAGERFNELGATKVFCGIQEQSNVALEERCAGLEETFEGEVISEFIGLDADTTAQENNVSAALQADPEIDGFMGTGPVAGLSGLRAAQGLGLDIPIASFDITTELIDAIEAGEVAFTVDQQQYMQGYLPVLFLYLNVTNANVPGGGKEILTGPGFIDKTNAAEVAALVEQGTR